MYWRDCSIDAIGLQQQRLNEITGYNNERETSDDDDVYNDDDDEGKRRINDSSKRKMKKLEGEDVEER